MAQTIHPLYGSTVDDNEVARSVNLPAGVYEGMEPTLSGAGGSAGWTAAFGVDTRSGRSLWRTAGDVANGRYVIEETTAIQLHIDGPSASPRIDLIVGIHKWVAGPVDPVTLAPTGEITDVQRPTYAVVKGTPGASPVAPAVPDPWDSWGNRPVILARVTVPVSGAATIERYPDTDLRLDYMRSICGDVVLARAPYPTLKSRLDAMGTATQVQSLSFRGSVPATGSNSSYQTFTPTTEKQYGSAVTPRSATTFGLSQPGLYEIMADYRVDQYDASNAALGLRAWLNYNGGTVVELDHYYDTNQQEYTGALYAQVYVDPSWTDPFVYFERSGWPSGSLRGSIKYLGTPETLQPLGIATGNLTIYESAGQTYPDDFVQNLMALNAVGAVTWSIVSGGGGLDGTSSPKAEIVNGSQLKITFDTRPGAFPATFSVNLSVTDSASTPRTATKTITITLNEALVLSITNTDFSVTPSSYPYTVSMAPIASGGATPYTWEVVAGADTTLPGAAYSGSTGTVTGTISADGPYGVRLRVTDSAATQVEKVVTITSTLTASGGGGGGGGGCVPAGTLFETVDGPIPIEQVVAGMFVRAYDETTLEPIFTEVEEVYVYELRPMAKVVVDVDSLPCSRDHRLYRRESRKTRGLDPHWPPVEELLPGDHTLYEVEPGVLVETVVLDVELLDELVTVYHVRLKRGHIYIAGRFPAHNLKNATPDDAYVV